MVGRETSTLTNIGRPSSRRCPFASEQQIDQTLKAEQRQVLLTFWADAPDEVVNLPRGIHEAFDIPIATDVKPVAPQPAKPAAISASAHGSRRRPAKRFDRGVTAPP